MSDGTMHLSLERAGHTSGFQRMSFKVDPTGKTLRVVQTAFDDFGNLVRQNPDASKNNLYDIKY